VSYVPNDTLESADSLNLRIFPIKLKVDAALITRDTWTQNRAFWKVIYLRNYQPATSIFYRVNPNDELEELLPLSERTIKGWGSYFEVQTAAGVPLGEIEMECVTKENAIVRQR